MNSRYSRSTAFSSGLRKVISTPSRMPTGRLISTAVALIFSATPRPPSRRIMFLPLNRTSRPKSGIAQPPFQQAARNGHRQQDDQIEHHQ